MKSIIANTARILFGAVFIFSGFVKAVDPLGFAYKITEYIEPLGIEWLTYFALPVAIGCIAVEFALGVFVLLGIKSRLMGLLAILFMAFMTPLTLYIALFNPVTDCGCFGDAVIIGNWETFYKNLIFSAFAVIIFIYHHKIKPIYKTEFAQIIAVCFVILIILAFSAFNLRYLPVIDFRPYKIGNNLREQMAVPDDKPKDVYEPATFIYEKNGEQKEFTLINGDFPDGSWKYVGQGKEPKLLQKGYVPPIRDFIITAPDAGEVTDWITENDNYLFLLTVPSVEDASTDNAGAINRIYEYALSQGYDFYALTASSADAVEKFRAKTGAEYPFLNADEKIIQTMLRANPGLILMKGGTVYDQWSHNHLPRFEKALDQDRWATPNTRTTWIIVFWSALLLVLPLCVLKFFDRK